MAQIQTEKEAVTKMEKSPPTTNLHTSMQKRKIPKTFGIDIVTSNNDGTKYVAHTVENKSVEFRNTSFDGIKIYKSVNRRYMMGMKQYDEYCKVINLLNVMSNEANHG